MCYSMCYFLYVLFSLYFSLFLSLCVTCISLLCVIYIYIYICIYSYLSLKYFFLFLTFLFFIFFCAFLHFHCSSSICHTINTRYIFLQHHIWTSVLTSLLFSLFNFSLFFFFIALSVFQRILAAKITFHVLVFANRREHRRL